MNNLIFGIAGGSGRNDGVKIMSCQIFHDKDGGDVAMAAKAIKYAADNGAAIIQCSYGYPAGSVTSDAAYSSGASAEKQAIDYFIAKQNCAAVSGGLAIFAAGNDMTGMSSYPGAYRDYISVTAMSCDYTPAYYTNYGPGCNIAAPGGDAYQSYLENINTGASEVLSTVNGGKYGYMQGTSMACPHVSGVAALGLSYAAKLRRHFTADEFKALLHETATPIDDYMSGMKLYYRYVADVGLNQPMQLNKSNYRGQMGAGQANAANLLTAVAGNGTQVSFPNLYINLGGEVTAIPANYFLGGETMTYTVSISDTTVATASVEGRKLTVKGLRSGTTKASITSSGNETHTFNITVRKVANGNGWL